MKITEAFARIPGLLLAMVIHATLGISAIQRDSVTADESDHLIYGVAVLKGDAGRRHTGRDFGSTMPVTAFNALPRAMEQILHPGLQKFDDGKEDALNGRYITLAFSLLLLVYVFLLARSLAGALAANLVAVMASVEPNLLAHGHLVTTDLYGALGFLASIYHFYMWRSAGKVDHFYAWCVALAFAQVAKYNNIVLYPAFGILLLMSLLGNKQLNYKPAFLKLVFFLMLQWFIISFSFRFCQVFFNTSEQVFLTRTMSEMISLWPRFLPFPLPLPYVDGMDMIRQEMLAMVNASNYLLGELKSGKAFPHYFIVIWHLKTPLLLVMLGYLAVWHWCRNRNLRQQLPYFLLPCMLLFILISTSSVQGGYRYLLPITSVLLACSAPLIASLWQGKFRYPVMAALLLLCLETMFWASNFIPYSNQLIPGKKFAYRFMADSNLDWQQSTDDLKLWLKAHPEVHYEPEKPVKGKILVSVNSLTGIFHAEKFSWLRTHQPKQHLWHCYLLYEIP